MTTPLTGLALSRSLTCSLVSIVMATALASCAAPKPGSLARSSTGGLEIRWPGSVKELDLRIDIAEWVVSCNQRYALVWGTTVEDMPLGQPAYSKIYVLNLSIGTILNSFTMTRGPYGAHFERGGREAMVYDGYLIDVATGRILTTEASPGRAFTEERCPA